MRPQDLEAGSVALLRCWLLCWCANLICLHLRFCSAEGGAFFIAPHAFTRDSSSKLSTTAQVVCVFFHLLLLLSLFFLLGGCVGAAASTAIPEAALWPPGIVYALFALGNFLYYTPCCHFFPHLAMVTNTTTRTTIGGAQPSALPLSAVSVSAGRNPSSRAAVPAHLASAQNPSTRPVASVLGSAPAQPPTGEASTDFNELDSVSPWSSESRGSSDDHSPNASVNGSDNQTRNTSSSSGGSIPEENL